jgi:regulator of RNase E activity RraA
MHNIQPRVQGVTPELLNLYRDISASTIGHLTDFGYVHNLSPLYRPIRILGNAVTVRIPHLDGSVIREALLLSQPGDVLVINVSGDEYRACWGELRTLAALKKSLAGVVIDGCVTDVRAITELGLPVFSRSISALTTRSLQMEGEVNTAISIGGVAVQPGNLVLADDDGLFVLDSPQAMVLAEAAQRKQAQDEQQRLTLISTRTADV